MDASRLRAGLRELLAADPRLQIDAAYLYGSQARGDARPDSDVDIAVLLREPDPARFPTAPMRMEDQLEKRLGVPVQVVSVSEAPPDLVHRILRDGLVIWEADRSRRIAFEVRARNEFFDVQPYLQTYRKAAAPRR